jgi:cysteine protease ATG4
MYNSNPDTVDFKKSEIFLFDKFYQSKESSQFKEEINLIIYFSYRSDFIPIDYNNQIWTTDCGWGCMIRASQMIFAKCIYMIKYNKSHSLKSENNIKESFYSEYKNKYNLINDTVELFLEIKKTNNNTSGNETLLDNNSIFQDFSIYNICNLGLNYGKGPGVWFSDINMVNIFKELNEKFKTVDNTEIFTFNENVIYEEEILTKCFTEKNCECIQKKIICQCLKIKNKNYVFNRSGIIFISFRVGLSSIDEKYVNPIKKLYSIKNNVGVIGGKNNYALYFIGVQEDKFLYLDPHFKQESCKSINDYYENHQQTYMKKNIYFLNIKSATPAFTFGVYFSSMEQFKQLRYSLFSYSKIENYLFKYKTLDDNINLGNINNDVNEEFKFVEEDDFCVVSK